MAPLAAVRQCTDWSEQRDSVQVPAVEQGGEGAPGQARGWPGRAQTPKPRAGERGSEPAAEQRRERAKAARPVSSPSTSGLPRCPSQPVPQANTPRPRPAGTLPRLHPVRPAAVSARAQPFLHRMSDGSSLVGFVDVRSIGFQSCVSWRLVSQVQALQVRVPV